MTEARFNLDEYTTRVLDVVKGKYGLKNRNEALNKFFREYGEDLVEPIIDENYLRELDKIVEDHKKNYKDRTMTLEELDDLLGLNDEE